MLTAVDLDDEAALEADEINNKILARCLPAEMEPAPAPRTQVNPELHLLPRHSFAQAACDLFAMSRHPAVLRTATVPFGEA